VCCGTKRLTEISCPETCVYLASSRAHPPAAVQRRQQRDLGFILPFVADLSERQTELLLIFQGAILRHAAGAVPPLRDEDVSDGAAAVAATLETAGKGIIYQHQAAALPAQRLAGALEKLIAELTSKAGAHAAALERDAMAALRAVARAAAAAAKALPEEEPPAYLKLIERMSRPDGGPSEAAAAARADRPSRLIIPG
jgi:hypothetical protein